jgi:hypothetical protein
MRSLPAILLAALTALVIALTALLTASHFGMRDWPTPPMPDTATRLITPTEAAGRARERVSSGDDAVEVKIAGDAGADARRTERRHRTGGTRHRADRKRRGASRRGERTGRGSSRHEGNRHSNGRRSGNDQAPRTDEPGTGGTPSPQPAPAPNSGEQSQARPDQTTAPSTGQGPALDPILPDLPIGGDGEGADDDDGGHHPAAGDDGAGNPGLRPGPDRRGPVGNLLDRLR